MSQANPAEKATNESTVQYASYHFTKLYKYSPQDDKRWNRRYALYFSDLLPADHSARILDLGCGGGRFLCFLKSRGYTNLVGVDRDEHQLGALYQVIACETHNADLLEFLSSCSLQYDVISCHHVIEHFSREESNELLHLAYTALRPGGRLILSTPNGARPWAGVHIYGDLSHDHLYTSSSLKEVLELAGFSTVELRPEGPVPSDLLAGVRWLLWKLWREPYLKVTFLIENGKGCLSGAKLIVSSGLIAAGTKPA
jgi:2-polyprenyl-3-methyl-5-hydroxy-6-metoxy-1,4-benzoquinol methylase